MILFDTGPLVAIFDPKDGRRQDVMKRLNALSEKSVTTLPGLSEAFYTPLQ